MIPRFIQASKVGNWFRTLRRSAAPTQQPPAELLPQKRTAIGVFYDGGHFRHVNAYYGRHHPVHAYISLDGFHQWILHEVARLEKVPVHECHLAEKRYFSGRLGPPRASIKAVLRDRQLDDELLLGGVEAHYEPLGAIGEKGVDVSLALEAYDMAIKKGLSVVVLVAGDGDFVPLVKKLIAAGVRVMIVGWNVNYLGSDSLRRFTSVSRQLVKAATYNVCAERAIAEGLHSDPRIKNIFGPKCRAKRTEPLPRARATGPFQELEFGTIVSLFGYQGLLKPDQAGPVLRFHINEIQDCHANALQPGDRVRFVRGRNLRAEVAWRIARLAPDE